MSKTLKYRKSIGGYILDSLFGVGNNDSTNDKDDNEKILTCHFCGKKHKAESSAVCQGSWYEEEICPKCQKKCNKCKRIFCPNHIKNHKCNK